jgi:ATPase subunit of ABC transporter with duplicated ATPase domains
MNEKEKDALRFSRNMPEITSAKPLVVLNLHKEFVDSVVLDKVSLSINPGDRIGLVGRNGSGKSTLMRIIAEMEIPDSGRVVNPGLRIGYLGQNFSLDSQKSVYEVATEGIAEFRDLLTKFEQMSEKYEHNNPDFVGEYSRILDILQRNNAFQIPENVRGVLKNLGIDHDLEAKTSTLSGGQLMRLALARILISKPDVLLLDEPTNHLDLYANLWLRNFLKSWEGGFIVVSHDRDFLDEVTESTLELDNGRIEQFGGNYSFYKEQKGLKEAAQEREVIRLTGEIRKAKNKIEKEKERAAHSARRDLSKNPEDLDRFRAHYFKERAEKSAGRKKSVSEDKKDKLIQKLREAKIKVPQRISPNVIESETHNGKVLVSAKNISCSYPNREVIRSASINISFGDRIAIFGNNGAGKSTLVQALLEKGGVNVKGDLYIASGINVQYLDQMYSLVDRNLTVVQNIQKAAPTVSGDELRKHLARFLFREDTEISKKASVLSGGELARLALAMMSIQPVDLLVLDEPTNNLDIDSIEKLESVLSDFRGAVLIVSHDISFIKNIGVKQTYVISGGILKQLLTTPNDSEDFKEELLSDII